MDVESRTAVADLGTRAPTRPKVGSSTSVWKTIKFLREADAQATMALLQASCWLPDAIGQLALISNAVELLAEGFPVNLACRGQKAAVRVRQRLCARNVQGSLSSPGAVQAGGTTSEACRMTATLCWHLPASRPRRDLTPSCSFS